MDREAQLEVIPWYMVAGSDGLQKDAILVAVVHEGEMQSVSLHVAHKAEKEPS